MQNPDIARLFDEVADLLEIQGANPFRVRAYRNAARVVRDYPDPLDEAEPQATALVAYLKAGGGIRDLEVAGSYRRRRETVGDLDVLATCADGTAVMSRFAAYPDVAAVLAQGPTRATVRLRGGLQVDLRAVEPDAYGAALLYFTGSKAHNVALRQLAQEKGVKLNEYGLYRGERRVGAANEVEIYRAPGPDWIPPDPREARGAIALAAARRLPPPMPR